LKRGLCQQIAWEYPDQKKVLEEKGIPTICFEMQKYQLSATDKKQIKTSLERFIEPIGRQR
jgi:benzoyl-CoA reductase/2-hydroxyglutaryl-CoA dehydratase subunit BcrC/BadD/HgdB